MVSFTASGANHVTMATRVNERWSPKVGWQGVGGWKHVCVTVFYECAWMHVWIVMKGSDLCRADPYTVIGFNGVCGLSGEIKANEMWQMSERWQLIQRQRAECSVYPNWFYSADLHHTTLLCCNDVTTFCISLTVHHLYTQGGVSLKRSVRCVCSCASKLSLLHLDTSVQLWRRHGSQEA